MSDESLPAKRVADSSTSKSEFSNVEFLETALSDPLNVLRAKLKFLEELPDDVLPRRVIIITDLISEEGRGLDVTWSEGSNESPFNVQDSVISMLTRVKIALAESGD